jgi:ubiquinone/menaquinone biosynthesis C-methylase UbiE
MIDKERFSKDIKEYWAYEHLHRYAIASLFVADKLVLDIASGEGYGADILSRTAQYVTGIDIDALAVNQASKKYVRNNLHFKTGSILAIPTPDATFDVITCFETLEHVEEHEQVFIQLKRVLKPGGLLLISSPNRKYYSDKTNYSNIHHKKELYEQEFKDIIIENFKYCRFYYQNTILASLIASEDSRGFSQVFTGDFEHFSSNRAFRAEPLFLIAICSDEEGVFVDEDSLFQFTSVYHDMDLQTLIYEYSKLYQNFNNLKNSRLFRLATALKYIISHFK